MITNDIITWVKKQPYWQQVIAVKLLNNTEITDKDIEDSFLIFKKENRLTSEPLEKKELNFSVSKTATSDSSTIKWRGLSNVNGVNAIKSNQKFPVGNGVTLIYGENGSGKSGYTRLLNNIFISRGDKNILPNLFEDTAELPNAKVVFEDNNGNVEELHYPNDHSHPYTKRITVFDSQSAIHDLTKEAELSFSPTEFTFFEDLLFQIEKVKNRFEEEISSKKLENHFINNFYKETSIKKAISELSSKTDIKQLRALIKVSKEDVIANEKNTTRKAELKLMDINGKKKEFKKIISDFEQIKSKIILLNQKFCTDNISKTKELISKRNYYQAFSIEEGLSQFKNEGIHNLESSEWKEFIKAAQDYYLTFGQEIDYCIFCKQDISRITLIDKYWKYLKSDAEKMLALKNNEVELIKNDFIQLECATYIRDSKIDDYIQENYPNLYDELINGENEFNSLRAKLVQALKNHEWNEDINSYKMNFENIEAAIKYINKQISKLNSDDIENEMKQLQKAEDEYIDKLKAEKLLPTIESFVSNCKWVELAEKNKITTRSITLIQNQLFSKYVTDEYVKRFNEECKKLKAEFSAEIKQRGSKGATLNRLTVKGKKPLEILSEGEQRSIALANFLAESSLHNNNICTVFDDPISSLDYKRREIIADRLIEEALQKQIVIFTHDLTFLLALKNKCEEKGLDCLSTTIRKIQTSTGIIEHALPWIGMSIKERISHLNTNLENLGSQYRKISPDTPGDIKVYEDRAKLWCKELRETWERSIEEILFNNSVQRFSPAIQTQRLEKAPFTRELYSEVQNGMKNCSGWVHDRAAGLGEATPDPDTLNEYLDDFKEFIKNNRPK